MYKSEITGTHSDFLFCFQWIYYYSWKNNTTSLRNKTNLHKTFSAGKCIYFLILTINFIKYTLISYPYFFLYLFCHYNLLKNHENIAIDFFQRLQTLLLNGVVVIHSDQYLMEILCFQFNNRQLMWNIYNIHTQISPRFSYKQHEVKKWLLWVMFLWFNRVVQQ